MWLSRVVVNREGGLKSLGPLLLPDDESERASTGHRMIWSLFPDHAESTEKRMHLWREESRGRFIVLSREKPTTNALLNVLEVKAFEPHLTAGDTLRFRLRANPTVAKRTGYGKDDPRRGKRTDVIMDAIHRHERGKRARPRNQQLGWEEDQDGHLLPLQAPRLWLDRQGKVNGFVVVEAVALEYQTLLVPRQNRGPGKRDIARIGVVDIEGVIRLTDPALFLSRLTSGFGSAKAFGCGLMLIRRV
ncbi:MAG: type I-E CRISPR-associated protein Cas6/Cse3/CasE [Agrobacterium albertimagni]